MAGRTSGFVKAVLCTLIAGGAALMPAAGATAREPQGRDQGSYAVVIVAPDRGAAGNRELQEAASALQDLPHHVLFIGDDEQGVEDGYRAELDAARDFLAKRGARRAVLMPLFVMGDEPLLTRFRPVIENALAAFRPSWTPALVDDYLFEEIVLDRFAAGGGPLAGHAGHHSGPSLTGGGKHPTRWLLFADAGSPQAAAEKTRQLAGLAGRLARIGGWPRPPRVAVLAGGDDPGSRAHDEAVLAQIRESAPAVVMPAVVGRKATPMMSVHHALARRLDAPGVTLLPELLPHPLIATHIERMVNAAVPPRTPAEVGLVLMAHGATKPYNDILRAWAARTFPDRPWALALGMADPDGIATALADLEARGVRHAVFYRLFAHPWTFAERADFIIGLRREPPAGGHMGMPARARTAIRLVSSGGYLDDPLAAHILADRARSVSRTPQREAVFVLSHGSGNAATEARQQAVVSERLAEAGRLIAPPFAAWHAMSLFEDWPAKREPALDAIRAAMAAERARGRRILVVSPRLIGPGPIPRLLDGESFALAGDGLLPHPLFAELVRRRVAALTARLLAHDEAGGAAAPTGATGRAFAPLPD